MNKLYYNTKNNTISLDKKNWIKIQEIKRNEEESFFAFSLADVNYLVCQWKDYVPKCFKEESNVVYYGNFLTIYDVPIIYCEEWEEVKGKDLEQIKDRFKELRKIKGESDDKYDKS